MPYSLSNPYILHNLWVLQPTLKLQQSIENRGCNNFDDLSYDELLNDFHDLHKNCEKLILKNCALKKKNSNLSIELEDFSKEKEAILTYDTCESLKNENDSLNAKVLDLAIIVHKFTNREKKFDMMLGG